MNVLINGNMPTPAVHGTTSKESGSHEQFYMQAPLSGELEGRQSRILDAQA